jgi:hypothetical protein
VQVIVLRGLKDRVVIRKLAHHLNLVLCPASGKQRYLQMLFAVCILDSFEPHPMGVVNNLIPGSRNRRTLQSGSLKKQEVSAFDLKPLMFNWDFP